MSNWSLHANSVETISSAKPWDDRRKVSPKFLSLLQNRWEWKGGGVRFEFQPHLTETSHGKLWLCCPDFISSNPLPHWGALCWQSGYYIPERYSLVQNKKFLHILSTPRNDHLWIVSLHSSSPHRAGILLFDLQTCDTKLWTCRRNFLPKIWYLTQDRDGILRLKLLTENLELWIWVLKVPPSSPPRFTLLMENSYFGFEF